MTPMLFIIKYAPEMITKSKPVRRKMSKKLVKNLQVQLMGADIDAQIDYFWDKIRVELNKPCDEDIQATRHILAHTSGIAHFLDAKAFHFEDFDDIVIKSVNFFKHKVFDKTFVVRCKRTGQHPFRSDEVEREIGHQLITDCPSAKVNLTTPAITINLEISKDRLYLVNQRYAGIGGYPIGELEHVISLISGGYDSCVASYLTMRRGMPTHFCFFNLGGREHELAVKEVALYLWEHFGAKQRIKFISVPFEEIVADILQHVDSAHMGVVLKRSMLKVATVLADHYHIDALVTGEAISQVSSQTLSNLSIIDKVTDKLLIRPLITEDKESIIEMARKIGTDQFSENIPEYCGVISVKPTTSAKLKRVEFEEAKLDSTRIQNAVDQAEWSNIDQLDFTALHHAEIHISRIPLPDHRIIDIRHPNDIDKKPLTIDGQTILSIPFFKLHRLSDTLSSSENYLLYCDKGIMSRLHASHLLDQGFNAGVYRPQ